MNLIMKTLYNQLENDLTNAHMGPKSKNTCLKYILGFRSIRKRVYCINTQIWVCEMVSVLFWNYSFDTLQDFKWEKSDYILQTKWPLWS